MEKRWCGYHQKMEPVSNFYPSQNCCKAIHIERVARWNSEHIEYRRAVARVHANYRGNKISVTQKEKQLKNLRIEFDI